MERAVLFRAAIGLRRRAAEALMVAVVAGLLLAPAFLLIAGARRTESAPRRYVEARETDYDVVVEQSAGAPLEREIEQLPSVRSVAQVTFLFAGLFPTEAGEPVPAITFAGQSDAIGARLVRGREVDPAHAGEFVATESWLAEGDYSIGDTFLLRTISQDQADVAGFDAAPDGPELTATLVGVLDTRVVSLDDDFPLAVFGPALLELHEPGRIAVSGSPGVVDLQPGTTTDQLRRELDSLVDGHLVTIEPLQVVGVAVRNAVADQRDALVVLAAIITAMAGVTATQVAVRTFRVTRAERDTLASLGYTKGQVVLETVYRSAPSISLAVMLGSVVAWSCSGWFPHGFAAVVEPDPGRRFDWAAHVGAPILVVVLLLGTVAMAAALTARQVSRNPRRDRAATRIPPTTMGIGTRFAFGSTRSGGTSVTGVAALSVVLTVTVAALTVAISLDRMLAEPANWGAGFDANYGQGGTSIDADVMKALESDQNIGALTLYASTTLSVGADALDVVAFSSVTGGETPRTIRGRLPQAADEVALGLRAAERLDLGIDERVAVDAPAGPLELRVVGIAVFPGMEGADVPGDAALVNAAGLRAIDPDREFSSAAISWVDGAPTNAAELLSAALGGGSIGPIDRPGEVVNLDRVRYVPYVIAAVVGAMALLSLVQIAATSLHRRQHDFAIVGALGATRGWIRRVGQWQSSSLAFAAIAVAVPVGVVIGRAVFASFPARIGASVGASIPLLGLAIVAGVLLAAANATAIVATRRGQVAVTRRRD